MNDNQFYQHTPNNLNNQYPMQNIPRKYEAIPQYSSPTYGGYNPPTNSTHNENNFKFNSEFSTNTQVGISSQIFQIESRLTNYSFYFTMLWVLLILSIFAIFGSIFNLTDTNLDEYSNRNYYRPQNRVTFETINFFVNLFHVGGYFFSINVFTKQQSKMNEYIEHILLGLAISNFVYFFFFIFLYHVTFFTWCMDIFYLIINFLLYFQAKDITHLFREKETVKMKNDINRM